MIFKPRRVLTAEHCVDEPGSPQYRIRAKSLFSKSQGEIAIVSAVERRANLDLAVLILDRDISTPM